MEFIENGIGLDIILWFQSFRSDILSTLFLPFNYAVKETVFLLILPALYWCWKKKEGKELSTVLLLTVYINTFFKGVWKRPRPYQIKNGGVKPSIPALNSYGLPSGHTMSAATFFGYLIHHIRKRWAFIVFSIIIICTALSRMIHGVHFPQDVIVGLFLSFLILFAFIKINPIVEGFIAGKSVWFKIMLVVICSIIMIVIYPLFKGDMQKGWKDLFTIVAVMSAMFIGFALEEEKIKFLTEGNLKVKLLRYISGFAVLVVIYLGFKYSFAFLLDLLNIDDTSPITFVFRFIRYFCVGFWVAYGAPLMFVKIKLAKSVK